MNKYHCIKPVVLVFILLLAPLQTALADDDHIEARHLLESGEILPLQDILKKVRQTYPGRVLEVELKNKRNKIIYEIEILGENGVINELYVDAKTGKLLLVKEED